MGITTFLLIGATSPTECRVIGAAIQDAGLQFFTEERWTWENALDGRGRFDPVQYTKAHLEPDLIPLKKEFPNTFTGFHFRDEPGLTDFAALGALSKCLRLRAEFHDMKIFQNLFPINANYAGLSGLARGDASARPPAEYGIDCTSGTFAKQRADVMAHAYGLYSDWGAREIQPDLLSFDLYPFDIHWPDGACGRAVDCPAARELTVSENLSIIRHAADLIGAKPVAYLENFQLTPGGIRANFHHLRWFAAWSIAFGVRSFANFISHSKTGTSDPCHKSVIGLFDPENVGTPLASDQQSVFGFVRHQLTVVQGLQYLGFVATFLGVNAGKIVASLPSDSLLVGEYESLVHAQYFLAFARRHIEGPVSALVKLAASYHAIEQLDITAGAWNLIAQDSDELQVLLDTFPGTLIRLSP